MLCAVSLALCQCLADEGADTYIVVRQDNQEVMTDDKALNQSMKHVTLFTSAEMGSNSITVLSATILLAEQLFQHEIL